MAKKQKKSLSLTLGSVLVDHINPTAVAQEDGDAAFHDTLKVVTTLTQEKLEQFFQAMGITTPGFFSHAPDEVPKIDLNAKYEGHTVRLTDHAVMPNAEVYDIKVARVGEETFEVELKFKGIPMPDDHILFMEARLDGVRGVHFDLSIEPPRDGANEEMPMDPPPAAA